MSNPKGLGDYHAAKGTNFLRLFEENDRIGIQVPNLANGGTVTTCVPVADLEEFVYWRTARSLNLPVGGDGRHDESFDDPAKPTPRELDHLLVAHRMDVRTAVREAWKAGYARRNGQLHPPTLDLAITRLEELQRELRATTDSIAKADTEQPVAVNLFVARRPK